MYVRRPVEIENRCTAVQCATAVVPRDTILLLLLLLLLLLRSFKYRHLIIATKAFKVNRANNNTNVVSLYFRSNSNTYIIKTKVKKQK